MLKIIAKLKQLLGSLIGKKPEMNLQDKELSSENRKMVLNEIRPIEGTPFVCALKEENQYVIGMGNKLVSEKTFYSRGAAEKFAKQIDMWFILNVVGIYVENYYNMRESEKHQRKDTQPKLQFEKQNKI